GTEEFRTQVVERIGHPLNPGPESYVEVGLGSGTTARLDGRTIARVSGIAFQAVWTHLSQEVQLSPFLYDGREVATGETSIDSSGTEFVTFAELNVGQDRCREDSMFREGKGGGQQTAIA